ncbi:hypothetical protein HZA33_02065, partial [Candidatus Pacearchaeota archaeon]|nr:hypothetical protein [Candidatus Pacearchaeota archaeon]
MAVNFETNWFEFFNRVGVTGDFRERYEQVKALYSEPHRKYHNLEHIEACLNEFRKIIFLPENPDAVEFALMFHDVVYYPKRIDNEEVSIRYLNEVAVDLKIPSNISVPAERLILATKHNYIPSNMDEKIITDIDLSIFGQDEEKFDEYDSAIRQEYIFVPEKEYREGRRKVLEKFLKRQRIYQTQFFSQEYEAKARENLERAIRRLK